MVKGSSKLSAPRKLEAQRIEFIRALREAGVSEYAAKEFSVKLGPAPAPTPSEISAEIAPAPSPTPAADTSSPEEKQAGEGETEVPASEPSDKMIEDPAAFEQDITDGHLTNR